MFRHAKNVTTRSSGSDSPTMRVDGHPNSIHLNNITGVYIPPRASNDTTDFVSIQNESDGPSYETFRTEYGVDFFTIIEQCFAGRVRYSDIKSLLIQGDDISIALGPKVSIEDIENEFFSELFIKETKLKMNQKNVFDASKFSDAVNALFRAQFEAKGELTSIFRKLFTLDVLAQYPVKASVISKKLDRRLVEGVTAPLDTYLNRCGTQCGKHVMAQTILYALLFACYDTQVGSKCPNCSTVDPSGKSKNWTRLNLVDVAEYVITSGAHTDIMSIYHSLQSALRLVKGFLELSIPGIEVQHCCDAQLCIYHPDMVWKTSP